MARLNDLIKFIVMINNFALVVLSIVALVMGVLILTGTFASFDPDMYQTMCIWAIVVGSLIFFLTLLGCAGAVRQVERKGCATGRTLLSVYQLALIGLLVVCVYLVLYWQKAIVSLSYTSSEGGGDFDAFEESISSQFNTNYFAAQCTSDPKSNWFFKLVDKVCPASMSSDACGDHCGNEWLSCPSEASCDADAQADTCPYMLCRVEAVEWLLIKIEPLYTFILASTYITASMILLTCLLICYNPRDDVTEELIKTGLYVESSYSGKKKKKSSNDQQSSSHRLDEEDLPMMGGRGGAETAQGVRPASQAGAKQISLPKPKAADSRARQGSTGPQRKNLLV